MTTVHQAIIQATEAIPAIGKDSENKDQHYKFRAIETIKTIACPILTKHGIFYVPRVTAQEHDSYTTGRGTVMQVARVTTEWAIFGPEGDLLEPMPITAGEGTDVSDKATNKAQSAAEKYMLTQVFKIADGSDDGDQETPEGRASSNVCGACGWSESDGHRPGCPAQAEAKVTEAFPGAEVDTPPPTPPRGRSTATNTAAGRKVYAVCRQAGLDPKAEAAEILGKKVRNTADLTGTEAGKVLDALKARGIH